MRTMKVVAAISLLAVGMAFGQSVVTYQLELGGDNHSALYESKASPMPFFTNGVTDNSKVVNEGDDLTWAVLVTADGFQQGGVGDTLKILGAANLVFDLVLTKDGVEVANFGAAPLACTTGTPGGAGAKNCKPTAGGFWSTINDGDSDDPNNGAYRLDTLANAAFAWGIYNTGAYPPAPGTQLYRLNDTDPAGPRFDYGWYPTSNGRGGVDTDGSKPINTGVTTVNSKLVGFGAGYKSYDATNHMAGVGTDALDEFGFDPGYGAGRPLFEGQINTTGLSGGTYVLTVVPSADGTNVVHGLVQWQSPTPNYGGAGSFAVKANSVVGSSLSFTVNSIPKTQVVARKLFYNNSWYDGNKVGIDPAPIGGANNDDADAIDTSKSALLPGAGLSPFSSWTGYSKGINGLIYDIKSPALGHPVAADFSFVNQGKAGTANTAVTTFTFATQATADPQVTRCIITFPDNSVQNCWLQVTIGTSIGLQAADVSYWGNAIGDSTGNTAPNITVSPSDEAACRPPNTRTAFNRATVDFPYDYNKDSIVGPSDESICRPPNQTSAFNCVKMITR